MKIETCIFNRNEKETDNTNNNNGENKMKKKGIIKKMKGKNQTISIKINRVEEKMVNNKDIFYVEMKDEEKKDILRKEVKRQSRCQNFLLSHYLII